MAVIGNEDEKEWIVRLQQGESHAFELLYQRYSRPILYKLLRLVHSEQLAEELHQEVFLKVWERRLQLDPEKSFGGFLIRIAHNLAMDFYRKAASDEKLREQLLRAAAVFYDPQDEAKTDLRHEQLMSAIAKLPPQRQKVFTLCKLEGQSYQHIARLLGVSVGTIKDHMAKASRFLKQELTKTDLRLLLILIMFL